MRMWTHSAGLLFWVVSSVYIGQATVATAEAPLRATDPAATAAAAADVKVLADPTSDLLADAPATQPSSAVDSTQSTPAPKVLMNDAGTFSIQINNDISLVQVLRMIGNQAQISIIPSKEVRGTVPAMDLYNVTVPEALDAILQTNGMAWRQKGNFIYVYSQKELVELEKASRITATEIYRLHYTPAANATNMIKPVLSNVGQVSFTTAATTGIESSASDAGGNTHASDDLIVVTDYPENLEKVRKIIQEVDRRPQQILIEATILQATLTDNNAMGVDFSFLGGVDFDTLLGSGTTLATALSGSVLNSTATSSGGTGTGTTSTGAGPILKNGYSGFSTGSFDTQVPAGGLQIGVVHDGLAVFLQALESVTNTTVLANPKVLALDKQRGEVIVGRQDGYLTTTTTQTTSEQTVQFLETGTRLLFRPYVGDDGYIRMEIHPEDSSGGLTSSNLPYKVTTEVTSNVMVKDGNTIVIGGLFRENSQTSRSQVPFLGNIPLAGALFRSQADTTQRQEIIILLTLHLVKDDAAYNKVSEDELKEAEKLRLGVRKGMMWFGRERLAESAYEEAVAEMNKPKPNVNKALWHLDCAINLNRSFAEAMDMKEKLSGKQVVQTDNDAIRTFVRRAIMADTAPLPTTLPSTILDAIGAPRHNEPTASVSATTQPTAAAGPSTRPALAQSPTTQPTVALSPATRPAVVISATTQPAESPGALEIRVIDSAEAGATPTTQPLAGDDAAAKPLSDAPFGK
jgi:type IV pilus assembly protein PilQ